MGRSHRASSGRRTGATTRTWSCRSGPPHSGDPAAGRAAASIPVLTSISLAGFRGYVSLAATFGPGAHLVWGPNAAGKTSLLEALVVCARGAVSYTHLRAHETGRNLVCR